MDEPTDDPSPHHAEFDSGASSASTRKKRPYTAPHLVEYGSVAKLTQGTLTTGGDGKLGGFKSKKFCL
jgi:hypothetical protein